MLKLNLINEIYPRYFNGPVKIRQQRTDNVLDATVSDLLIQLKVNATWCKEYTHFLCFMTQIMQARSKSF